MSKVLLIDDDLLILQMLTDRLQKEGYVILQAKDGQEGLTVALQEKPALIILDIVMPVMDGLTMLKRLREHPGGISMPVIILSSQHDGVDISEAMSHRVFQYIVKENLDMDLMLENIRLLLQGK